MQGVIVTGSNKAEYTICIFCITKHCSNLPGMNKLFDDFLSLCYITNIGVKQMNGYLSEFEVEQMNIINLSFLSSNRKKTTMMEI
jgi:hypothetical protein